MTSHWILVGDASGARIFSIAGRNKPLQLVKEFSNADGRKLTQDLVSDEPGRMSKGGTPGMKSAMDPRTTAHEAAAQTFAKQLADYLKHHSSNSDFASLSLVAPAHFRGLLRSVLSRETDALIRSSLTKDLVHTPANQLMEHIESLLVPGLFQ